ncbi:MAG: SpoIIE family protein phosphatase, partial [Desulfobacterales bacterium]|nr:SpoIIE family protein phosphatase [Desulfobacterales bacterium]
MIFNSLRIKLFVFIAIILILTAAAITYITNSDVETAFFKSTENSTQNILQIVETNVDDDYNKIFLEKLKSIVYFRRQIKNISDISISIIKYTSRFSDDHAKQEVLGWAKSYNSINNEITLMICDENGIVISHSNPSFIGTSIKNIKDIKGKSFIKLLYDDVSSNDPDYVIFKNDERKKLGYFVSIKNWGWIVGTVTDLSNIENEIKRNKDKIIETFKRSISKITIAETGCVYLLNGKKEPIFTPACIFDKNKHIQRYIRYFKPLDFYIVADIPYEEIKLPAKTLITRQTYIITAIFFISLILSYSFVTKAYKPLKILASYVKTLSSINSKSLKEKEVKTPIDDIPIKFKDEVGLLAKSFLTMKDELKKNICELVETTAIKERVLSELNIARTIQLGMLPKDFPDHPQFDLYAILEPAKEVGGDLYDFFFIDDIHLCFTLGDVSDKGMPAALFMAITKALIKTVANQNLSPPEIMFKINNILCEDNPNSMFVTLIIGILNINTGELFYANGGHTPPIILSKNNGVFYKKDISGLIVGVIQNTPYIKITLSLEKDDAILLYTDGVSEAMDIDNVLFSYEKLISDVESLKNEDCKKII